MLKSTDFHKICEENFEGIDMTGNKHNGSLQFCQHINIYHRYNSEKRKRSLIKTEAMLYAVPHNHNFLAA